MGEIIKEMETSHAEDNITPQTTPEQKRAVVIGIVVIVVLVILFALGVYALALPTTDTGKVRDIFIIIMAIESLVIGFSLVILLVQLARLINLLQNEIKPILDSTNDTVNHLRGTTVFLSENLVSPVIKLNEYLAGITQLLKIVGIIKKSPKSGISKGE